MLENWVGLLSLAALPQVVQDDLEVYATTELTGDAGASIAGEEFAKSECLKALVVAPCGIQIGG